MMLNTPFRFNPTVATKNRIAVSPLTNTQSHSNGTLSQTEYDWLLRLARGGFGMIVTCASYIHPHAKAWDGQIGIDHDDKISELKQLTKALRSENSVNIMQIFHGGVRCPSQLTGVQPMSASVFEFNTPDFEKPRAMTLNDIQNTIDQFAHATKRAYEAGFHGVELHGANGYLITQFLSTQSNLRQDEYGGPWINRARFVREITQACRQVVPKDFIIGIRLLPEGPGLDLDENIELTQWLVEDGIDYLSISHINAFASPQKYEHANSKPILSYFREQLGSDFPIISGGSIRTPKQAEEILSQGATFATLGRMAIGNPTWPQLASLENFQAIYPPYRIDDLRKAQVSERFIQYLQNMPKGFVLE